MIKNTTTAEHYTWGSVCEGFRLLDRAELSVIEERIPPGAGELRHFHQQARQCFYVLQGALEIQVADEQFQLSVADSLEVSPGQPHRVRNTGVADAVFLVISAPSKRADRTNLE
jgi:mannose-6-phosphate isomerase-like protein (cupin superfamily)